MKTNFKEALKHVLVHEGGWADHPRDPGGATMKGVTLLTYRRFFGKGKTKKELKNISDQELEQIYSSGYWSKCRCDDLPAGVDYSVFDAAVNSGPGRGAKWLQASVGAVQDGGVGPVTLSFVKDQDPVQVIDVMCDCRLTFLQGLPTWPDFGKGWRRRVEGVRATAVAMAGGAPLAPETIVPSIDYVTVKNGSKGPWVRKLQQVLEIPVDGVFGNGTETALRKWQKDHELEPDGIAGRNTYRTMGLIP